MKLDERKHYKFVPVYPDEYGCCLRHQKDDEEPEDGAWNWWMDKDGNIEYARFKYDAMDHFFPSTKYLNIPHGKTDVECLAGYFKEVEDGERQIDG